MNKMVPNKSSNPDAGVHFTGKASSNLVPCTIFTFNLIKPICNNVNIANVNR